MNILVTGSKGQVGNELQALAANYPVFSFVYIDREELDITNTQKVNAFFDEHAFDYCLNCAAYTAVDKAESDAATAQKVNVLGTRNLATAAQKQQCRFIQISTDYVYHNNQNTPFIESDPTHPQGVYAQTKLDGDLAALALHSECLVIRTSWVYSSFGQNFVKTMLRLGKEKSELGIIFDQIGSPTYARHLAQAMLDIVQLHPAEFNGIYHYSNEGVCSWYDFARAIFELKGIECTTNPIETKDYPTPAKRPHFSLLNKAKIKQTFKTAIPHWRSALEECLQLM
jgi:dTDP-4-dehydrorhamnose reductase